MSLKKQRLFIISMRNKLTLVLIYYGLEHTWGMPEMKELMS